MNKISMLILCFFAIPNSLLAIDDRHSEDTIEKLQAFAKTYGYVRFFHPSDQASLADWDAFAIYGTRAVLNSPESQTTEALLRSLFEPLVVDLEFYRGDEKARPETKSVPQEQILAWQHSGVGLGQHGLYRSERTNRDHVEATQASAFGNVMQYIPAVELRGKEVRYRFQARVTADQSRLQGWVRVDRQDGMGWFDNMGDRPIQSEEWQEYEISGTIDDDADYLALGVMFFGAGGGLIDNVVLEQKENDEWKTIELENQGFEEGTQRPSAWACRGDGYRFQCTTEDVVEGEQAMQIELASTTRRGGFLDIFPELGEVIDAPIARDLRVRMPLALHVDTTYSSGDNELTDQLLAELSDIDPQGISPAIQSAANVVIAWNVFQHFYPYFPQVETDWDSTLTASLNKSLKSTSRRETTETLQWMVAQLHDGHGAVWDPQSAKDTRIIPVRFDWIENQLIVRGSDDSRLEVGDIVTHVGEQTAESYLIEKEALISGSPQWKRYRSTMGLAMAEQGTQLPLKIMREDQALEITLEYVGQNNFQAQRKESIELLVAGDKAQEHIYYVDLGRVEPSDVQPMIDKFSEARGIVFDLRGYPRGTQFLFQHMTDQHMQSQKWQVPQQVHPDRVDMREIKTTGRWEMPAQQPRFQGKMVFLTNASAISYAESCMSIVAHYQLGEIIGSPTAGANGNVNPFALPGGWQISWTGMRVMNHDDSQHHVRGVQPTIAMEPTIAGIKAGRDELLDKALELIQQAEID